jgi:hypothetical protein
MRENIGHTEFWYERESFEHIGVDRSIVLNESFNKLIERGYALDSSGLVEESLAVCCVHGIENRFHKKLGISFD